MKKLQNLLIVGCGDVARRVLPLLQGRYRIFAALRDRSRFADWRERGAIPLLADLDQATSLRRLSRLAGCLDIVLHFAPPANQGAADFRTRRLLAALMRG